METISRFALTGDRKLKQDARESIGTEYDVLRKCSGNEELIGLLSNTTLSSLDRKIKHGMHLTFEEAFCGMCYVLAATNKHLCRIFQPLFEQAYGTSFSEQRTVALGAAFLNLMAAKESLSLLTPEEIAGMVTATMMDSVIAFDLGSVVETCGMGGDKGFGTNGVTRKSFNVSTLSSLVLSALNLPVIKHGSYGNSSLMGSTDAIEKFGAKTSMHDELEVWELWGANMYCYFDAHLSKTIHDLSHLLMMETINHVIGPMTPPVTNTTTIHKLMGVNEKIHPETIVRAYNILHSRDKQTVGGIVVAGGLDNCGPIDPLNYGLVRQHVIVDEMSPFGSVVSFGHASQYLGTFILHPEDFGVTIDSEKIQIENDSTKIMCANALALSGEKEELTNYLAMNAAMGLYAMEYLQKDGFSLSTGPNRNHLQECFRRCRDSITSGKVKNVLQKYVEASGGKLSLID